MLVNAQAPGQKEGDNFKKVVGLKESFSKWIDL